MDNHIKFYIEKHFVMNINKEDLQEYTCIDCMLDSGSNGAFLKCDSSRLVCP